MTTTIFLIVRDKFRWKSRHSYKDRVPSALNWGRTSPLSLIFVMIGIMQN